MASTELARTGAHLPAVTDEGFLEEVRTQLAPKASDSELRYFAQVVAKTQLDPWSRQVYLIPRWDGRVKREVHRPQTSIDGLRLIAERTGKYEGQTPVEWCGDDGKWRDTWFEDSAPRASRVGVFKSGRAVPTYAVAHYDEYVVLDKSKKPTGLWRDKPRVMIAKCAEALALRKAFPQETSGLYTAEEMGRAGGDAPAPVEVLEPAAVEHPADPAESVVEEAKQQLDATEIIGPDVVKELNKLYAASGWKSDKTADPHEKLRWSLAEFGADANEPDIRKVVAGLTVEQAAMLDDRLRGIERDGES